jgi:hypothetical protein
MSALEYHPHERIIRNFSLKLRLARSAELALAGSLFRAEELLMPGGELPKTAEELDLLARILVRQKRYVEAQKRWNDALRVSNGESRYQDALDSLNCYLETLKHKKQIQGIVAIILIIFLLAGIGFRFLLQTY